MLSDRYTVVTYDPGGLSRSAWDGEPQDTTVETLADDAHRLLAEVVFPNDHGWDRGPEAFARKLDEVLRAV